MGAEWPPIADQQLLERLLMGQDEFFAYVRRLYESQPAREYEAELLASAVEYPFARPAGSFLLADRELTALDDLAEAEREVLIGGFAEAEDRHPVLAIGSNGSPQALREKFIHFERAADREVLVLTGWLHDFDIGAAPQPALYGSMPATIFPSPGTRVRAALLWVTTAQFTQLAWSEVNYLLGRLRTRFDVDHAVEAFAEVFVFVSRFGAFCPAGDPIALAAIPAEGRAAPALTQEEILDAVAARALGPEARAADLVRAIHTDLTTVVPLIAERVWPASTPFKSPLWEPLRR